MEGLWCWVTRQLEEAFNAEKDRGYVSQVELYNINARIERNYWFDKKGNKWPLRDSI